MKNLSIITITYNNSKEFSLTYNNLKPFRKAGGTHIIINGGDSIKIKINNSKLIEEPDAGIYDAINKGIKLVTTDYFMIIHSGDELIGDLKKLKFILNQMEKYNLDLSLNNCFINNTYLKRFIKSDNWNPWMLKVGVQPPHPPSIYKSTTFQNNYYDISIPVISDFKCFEEIFAKKIKFKKHKAMLVRMSPGGKTSGGWKSFFYVSIQFIKYKGLSKGILFFLFRPILKNLQRF